MKPLDYYKIIEKNGVIKKYKIVFAEGDHLKAMNLLGFKALLYPPEDKEMPSTILLNMDAIENGLDLLATLAHEYLHIVRDNVEEEYDRIAEEIAKMGVFQKEVNRRLFNKNYKEGKNENVVEK